MKKDIIIANVLKLIALLILGYGAWIFLDWRLWRDMTTNMGNLLQIFLPIVVLGFSGCLYGIAYLIVKNNK